VHTVYAHLVFVDRGGPIGTDDDVVYSDYTRDVNCRTCSANGSFRKNETTLKIISHTLHKILIFLRRLCLPRRRPRVAYYLYIIIIILWSRENGRRVTLYFLIRYLLLYQCRVNKSNVFIISLRRNKATSYNIACVVKLFL